MTRFAYALLVGIVCAGIVHIVVLFLVPYMTERDAWTRLSAMAELYEPIRIDTPLGREGASIAIDPLFEAVACRFDLGESAVRISAPGRVPFWSISVYDRAGQNIFSLNDRSATGGLLDIVILTPLQMLELRNELPREFERSIFVEADIEYGLTVVRSFVPDESWEPRIAEYLEGLSCTSH